jgi:drug/metabolite transporter (DMT)-like permease
MSSNLRAILICLLAYICFDTMAVHVRILSERYSPQELSVYRNVLGVLPSVVLLAYSRELSFKLDDYKIKQWKLAFGRGLFVAIAQLLFYTALANLELATVSALGQTNALFVVLIAIIIYGETVGAWRWGAVILGFVGALLIVQPGTEVFTWTAILPIGAAFCYAASIVTLRSFDKSISSAILYLYSATAAAIGAILLAATTTDFSPIQSVQDGLLIFSMSICGGFGVVFLMFAFRNAPASVLAPFSYFGIITAFVFGWFFFGEFPVDTLFPGILFIVASGLIILWREQQAKSP